MQTTFVRQGAGEGPAQERAQGGASPSGLPEQGSAKPSRAKPGAFKPRSNSGPGGDRGLIEALSNSKIFQDYERAFTEATGLPVALRPVESWQLPHHGKRNESPFCAMVLETSRACCLLSAGAGETGRRAPRSNRTP